ncbi:MAG: 50S ribosomal protein L24 [Parcubacteria group bacterium]
MKIKKGDKVQIIKGNDRVRMTKKGEKSAKSNQGKVIHVLREKNQVVVEGLNLRFKHVRPKREGEKGQRIELPTPIKVSNIMLVCPKCGRPARVGYQMLTTGAKSEKKIRICKKCKEAID